MCFVAMSCALIELWHVLWWLGVFIGAERRRVRRHVLCSGMCFVAMSCALIELWHVLWLGVFIGAERRRGLLLIHCAASCALLRHVLCGDVMRFD